MSAGCDLRKYIRLTYPYCISIHITYPYHGPISYIFLTYPYRISTSYITAMYPYRISISYIPPPHQSPPNDKRSRSAALFIRERILCCRHYLPRPRNHWPERSFAQESRLWNNLIRNRMRGFAFSEVCGLSSHAPLMAEGRCCTGGACQWPYRKL